VIAIIMVVIIVALFLASLLASTGLAAIGRYMHGQISLPVPVLGGIDFCVSVLVFTALFAFVFKVVPDARIAWHEVRVGAVVTSLLFNIGKLFISQLLGHNRLLLSYGAAASFVVIIVWVYFSAQLVLFGAELTRMHILHRQDAVRKNRHHGSGGVRSHDTGIV
jgi:membrane protein